MGNKIIKTGSFWYRGQDGVERTALRGETVDLTDDGDIERGERLDAFATDADLKPGNPFGDWYTAHQANQKAATDAGMPELVVQPAERPGDNDSRAKWADYARSKDAPEVELAPVNEGGLSRDALREKYGA